MTQVDSDTHRTLLSVIIPAYNVEAYIGESLESALRQPRINEIELIVVDDGSTDSTLDRILAIKGSEQGHNIRVIHQENRGVSAARNAAIAHARSPYIGFLDADDVWSPNFSDVIMPLLEAGTADIIEFNVGIIDSKGRIIERMELIAPGSVGPREGGMAALMEFARVWQVFPGARVYRRELWEGVEFPAGRVYEDCSAIPLIYTRARTLHRLADELYCYRRRAGSITQTATVHTVKSLAISAEEALARCDGGVNAAYWMAMFHKNFARACFQTARVNRRTFSESMRIVEATAARYRTFTEQRPDELPRLRFHMRIFAERRVFQVKRVIKRVFGLELRPRPVEPAGLSGHSPPAASE